MSIGSAHDALRHDARGINNQFRADRQTKANASFDDLALLVGRDAIDVSPRVDSGGALSERRSHGADTAEQCEKRDGPLHAASCAKISLKTQGKKWQIRCAKISQSAAMENVSTRLRALRKSAKPRLTVRALAAALDMPLGSYTFYETDRYKRPTLPLDLTRKIAAVMAAHNVDPAEVMKLAGLSTSEVEPEAQSIEAQKSKAHFFTAQVLMPSENALAAMFESLLALIPENATRAEAARILAQRLPTGFSAIGPAVYEVESDEEPEGDALPLTRATDHLGSLRPLHT